MNHGVLFHHPNNTTTAFSIPTNTGTNNRKHFSSMAKLNYEQKHSPYNTIFSKWNNTTHAHTSNTHGSAQHVSAIKAEDPGTALVSSPRYFPALTKWIHSFIHPPPT